MDMKAESS